MCLAFKPVSWELRIYFKDQYQVQAPVRHHNWWLPHLDNHDRIKNIFKISVIGKTFGYLLDLVNLFRVYARRVMELNNLTRWHTLKEILQLLVPRGYLHFFTSQLIITFAVCTKHAENVNKVLSIEQYIIFNMIGFQSSIYWEWTRLKCVTVTWFIGSGYWVAMFADPALCLFSWQRSLLQPKFLKGTWFQKLILVLALCPKC